MANTGLFLLSLFIVAGKKKFVLFCVTYTKLIAGKQIILSLFCKPGIATVIKTNEAKTVKTEVTDKTHEELQEIPDEGWEFENNTIVDTRRILHSKKVAIGKRPYMVRSKSNS